MNKIILKLINSKIAWICLGVFLFLSLILFIFVMNDSGSESSIGSVTSEETNKYYFALNGSSTETMYVGETYNEKGYRALNEKNQDISNQVSVEGNIVTTVPGKYELTYTLKISSAKEIVLKRVVEVIERNYDEVELILEDDEIIYLPLNSEYREFGATAYIGEDNVTDEIIITKDIDTTKVGIYEVNYSIIKSNVEKKVTRKVVVFDISVLFALNKMQKTKENVFIEVNLNNYFSYVVLPTNVIEESQSFSYEVKENGTYTFSLYDKHNNKYTHDVSISNIDKEAPSGSCKAILFDGKTTFTVTSSDNDIKKYLYNDVYSSTSKNFTAPKFLRNAKVTLIDEVENMRIITCQTQIQALPVINPKQGETVQYKASSDSLVINITKNNGYYLTRIWAKDPFYQMRKELVTGNSFQRPKVILETAISKYNLQNKIVFGGNASAPIKVGSYYDGVASANNLYNLKEPSSLLVYNGSIIINDYEKYLANTIIYYLDGSNQLKYIPRLKDKSSEERKKVFDEVIQNGVYNTFTFSPVLVSNYQEQNAGSDYNAFRQGFCQIDSNNFILVTSDTKRWKRQEFANFMQSIGCKTAVNFDGGGSVALFYKPKGTNTVKTLAGNERSLSSVMYFTELD